MPLLLLLTLSPNSLLLSQCKFDASFRLLPPSPNKHILENLQMLSILFTLLAVASATLPHNSTILQFQFHGSITALNHSADRLFDLIHSNHSLPPALSAALDTLPRDRFLDAVSSIAHLNVTIDSPVCHNNSHLSRKCLRDFNQSLSHQFKSLIYFQTHACTLGLSSLTSFTFQRALSTCLLPTNSSSPAQLACLQDLALNADNQLSALLTQSDLHTSDSPASDTPSGDPNPLQNALRTNRRLYIELTTSLAALTALALLPFLFLTFLDPLTFFLALTPLLLLTGATGASIPPLFHHP